MSVRTHLDHAERVRAVLDPAFAALADETELIAIHDPALAGRVAAHTVVSPIPLPPFDNSQMDGYAVRVADFGEFGPGARGVTELRIGRTIAAGDAAVGHEAGTAAPIMTGAPIPAGADAVIPIEQADPARFTELRRADDPAPRGTVRFRATPAPGAFVRPRGSDLAAGAPLIAAGTRLTPARIGLLANAGVTELAVHRRPRVLLLSTGDEVAAPGTPIDPGHVGDANTPMLTALMTGLGAEVSAHRAPDLPDAVERVLAAHGPAADLIVTSGGISAGAFEVVREVLTAHGVEFGGIALQPGGPQGLGYWDPDGARVPVLCFPGNPVSSALSAELFLAPALRAAAGRPERLSVDTRELAHAVDSPAQKHQVRRGRFDAAGRVHLTGPSSHLLADLAAAELLAHIPLGVDHLPAGSPIEIWRLDV